jgi:putative membrane protein insertion efficiency factor
MNLSQHNQFSSKASQLLSWGHWFTFANIGLALLISLSYLFADSPPTSFMGITYMLVTWLSHTSFIAFLAFVLTVFPLSLVFPYPRHIRGMAAVIATCGASLLTLDAYVYVNLGYHLNPSALPEIISLLWNRLTTSPALTTFLAGGIVLLILGFQLVVSNYTWHHLARLKQFKFARYAISFLVVCFAFSHSIHIWADANLKFDITKQDNVLPLSYPTTAKSLLAIIRVYKLTLSPLLIGSCRFSPSCSSYAAEAVDTHGAIRGGWLAIRRMVQCRPFGRGGCSSQK